MFDRICCCQGMLGITLVNVIPAIKPMKGGPPPPAGMGATKGVFWAFMYLTVRGNVVSAGMITRRPEICLRISCG
jgi:hypothetical protein